MFLERSIDGRRFDSLAVARQADVQPGDTILIRDLAQLAPAEIYAEQATLGKWHLRPYQLGDGQNGQLLEVNTITRENPESGVPPAFEVNLDLPGWYAIWIGVPRIDYSPRMGFPAMGGVDLALEGDPAPVHIGAERGTRKSRIIGPDDVEIMCYWKCAQLDRQKLRIHVPYGTFFSLPWGLTRASMSALQLVKLSDAQVADYQRDISDPATKRVIEVNDGFSHYWFAAKSGDPENLIDARLVQQYRDGDVGKIIFQSPGTGATNWPSEVASLLGDGVTEEVWSKLRMGDRRTYNYLKWVGDNGYEGMRVIGDLCRQAGIEFHASLRMNLFFAEEGIYGPVSKMINGRFWHEHPEMRNPDSPQLDYAQPEVRHFILATFKEIVKKYQPHGINLDFTRWPPVADPARHSCKVLTSFIHETRQMLDEVGQKKGQRISLSALVVDGYHAHATLADQKIDLEAWLSSGDLDFIGVQAWEHAPYLILAKHYGVPYYALQDNGSIRTDGVDPEWVQEDRPDEDPLPGEEFEEHPHLNSSLDPTEYDEVALRYYQMGADGFSLINNFVGMHSTNRLGHVEEMSQRVKTGAIWGQVVGPTIKID
jgi:hypothetical protein